MAIERCRKQQAFKYRRGDEIKRKIVGRKEAGGTWLSSLSCNTPDVVQPGTDLDNDNRKLQTVQQQRHSVDVRWDLANLRIFLLLVNML